VIEELFVSAACLVFFLLYLLAERIHLSYKIRKIPLRICVTGTRGKSSVTRLITGVLRGDGLKVLAKTTGSKPVLLFPDGSEQEIQRKGNPSILEGKDVLDTAAKLGAQAVVAELMGIRPESISVESVSLFRPHLLVITNARLDHLDQMGESKEEIARCFASALPERSVVFVPDKEFFPVYEEIAERKNSKILRVPENAYENDLGKNKIPAPFARDVQLSLAVAEFMNIDMQAAVSGMKKVLPDFGSLKMWAAKTDPLFQNCLFVSAFAANDPESTKSVLELLRESGSLEGKKIVALLCFRRDRGDRTRQWLKALQEGFFSDFDRVVLLGEHSHFVKRRKKHGFGQADCFSFRRGSPRRILADVVFREEENAVIGLGNIGGIGKEFVNYWQEIGETYDF
jgi:poly-gamma-glutamate synthase PgsB/CapB